MDNQRRPPRRVPLPKPEIGCTLFRFANPAGGTITVPAGLVHPERRQDPHEGRRLAREVPWPTQ